MGKPLGSPVQKPTPRRSISTKVLLAEGEDTPFAEHCRHYEDSYRVRGAWGLWAGEDPPPLPHQEAEATLQPPVVNVACRSHRHSCGPSRSTCRQVCKA